MRRDGEASPRNGASEAAPKGKCSMNFMNSMNSTARIVRAACLALGIVAAFAASGLAQNSTADGARVLVGDGSVITDSMGTSPKWFAAILEGGHSYAVEVVDTIDGLGNNHPVVDLWEADGTTSFFTTNTGACGTPGSAGPGLEGAVPGGADGVRCLFYPALDNGAVTRVVKIRVRDPLQGMAGGCQNCSVRVRIRETTISSRWSVNGYDMFVALHNNSTVPMAGQVLYYGDAPAGPASTVAVDGFTLGRLGSQQFVRSSLTLNPNHGSVHVILSGSAVNGGVDCTVQTYAYSVTQGTFNTFTPEKLNHGGPFASLNNGN